MPRKKIEVVELNKKEEKIVLEEKQSPLLSFFHHHNLIIFLTALILGLTILILGVVTVLKNISINEEILIKKTSIDTTLENYQATVIVGDNSSSDENAKNIFLDNQIFKSRGEVLLVKTVESSNYIIRYYSDGTAVRVTKNYNIITRINPLPNGEYGVNKNGMINSQALISEVNITETKVFPWGTVTYYSDGSAEISNSKIDMFVRNAKDINETFISNNKVSYLKETQNIGSNQLNYYYDGTIEIIKNNKSYIVRNEEDIEIKNNDIIFKNDNAGEIYKTSKMSDGIIIDYYTDGGAIIRDGTKTISVRKSNSIIIKNNKIYEIIDNIYVEISKKTNNTTYYTNGGAVINYNNKEYYIDENSLIKYNGNAIKTVPDNKQDLANETNISDESIKFFTKTAVVTTKDYIAIVDADEVILDTDGKVKELEVKADNEKTSFEIINNTNETIKYRVAIKQESETNLDIKYIRYMMSYNGKVTDPAKFEDTLWKDDDLSKSLDVTGTNYILLDGTLDAGAREKISMMLWTDYDTIPNAMQDKYFYGTIKVYAWQEIEK